MHGYTREAGVRELERRLARLARKLARGAGRATRDAGADAEARRRRRSVCRRRDAARACSASPRTIRRRTSLEDKVGVATGLAYTSVGGDVLEIEVSVVPGRGKLQLTGTLGDVMKESASAALSYARARANALGLDREFHAHARHPRAHSRRRDTEGRTVGGHRDRHARSSSALTGIPVRGDVAMTGEITLRGRVLADRRAQGEGGGRASATAFAHVIMPQENARDLDELPAEVRGGDPLPSREDDGRGARGRARRAAVTARADDEPPTMVAH